MKYFVFFLCVFIKIAFADDNLFFDVKSSKNIFVKVLLKNNDSLSVSIFDKGKPLSTEEIDISSEKKITLYLRTIILMVT